MLFGSFFARLNVTVQKTDDKYGITDAWHRMMPMAGALIMSIEDILNFLPFLITSELIH